MRFLACNIDISPCPFENQVWVTLAEFLDPALYGITSADILKVFSWGFGAVLLGFFLGYQLGLALGLIKKL